MLEVISWFVIGFVTNLLDCLVFCWLTDNKYKITFKMILTLTIVNIISCYTYNYYPLAMRLLFNNIELAMAFKILYNESWVKTLLGNLFALIAALLSEIIFSIIFLALIGISSEFSLDNAVGIILSNGMISLFYVGIFAIKPIRNSIKRIMAWIKDTELINTIILVMMIIIFSMLLLYPISYNIVDGASYYGYVIILIGMIILISGFFNQKSKNNQLISEYDNLLEYVKTYEKAINEKSKKQHEYKNQLVIIKDMVKNKKADSYISELLNENEESKNHDCLRRLVNIPSGGLKGLFYYKIEKMLENKIEVFIDISDKLANKKKWSVCDEELQDLSRVIGVYLDNAIEAATKAPKKFVIIEADYENNNVIFTISNTYTGNIDMSHMDKEGYTTKGKGKGYGLSLVKDILDSNIRLDGEREINGQYYVQKLTIKK